MYSDENRGLDYSEKGTKSTKRSRVTILGDPWADKGGEGEVTFFRPFRLSLVPTICPWVSEDEELHDVGNSAQDAFNSWTLKLNSS